jgi:dCTP deaminase
MIINGVPLLIDAPIKDMLTEKHREHGVSHGLGEVGYDIRIKQEIKFIPYPDRQMIRVSTGRQVEMLEGRFVIASAIEEFTMPSSLAGVVHDKSTWARRGLAVFNTVIEPGWRGFLTLDLVYHGRRTSPSRQSTPDLRSLSDGVLPSPPTRLRQS